MKSASHHALQQAAAALGKGDNATVETLCRRVLDTDPESVDGLNLLSLARKGQGDAAAAETLMKKALTLDPQRPDIRGNLANLYVTLQRRDEAEAEYLRALDVAPRFRPARLGLARLLLDSGRPQDARAEAEKLTHMDASDAEAWNVVGSAYRQESRTGEAEQAFRRALSIAPGYAVARHNLGALLASLSRSEEALNEFEALESAGFHGAEISHNHAAALMSLGRMDEAEHLLLETLDEMPGAVSLQMLLARIRYMRGNSEFSDVLGAAVRNAPDDAALRVAYTRVLCGAGQFQAAIDNVKDGLRSSPRDSRLLAEMSSALHHNCEYEEALHFAQQAVAAEPEKLALNDLVIQALLSLGSAGEAMPLIEAARRRAPLDQFYIALEATAARVIGDPRYERLYDYERLVQRFTLPVPPGWSSIEDFHRDLVPVLKERHKFVAPPLDQSLRGGTQTPRSLLSDPEPTVKAFLDAVRAPIQDYRDRMGADAAHPLSARNHGETRLIGCWSVRLHRNGFHVNHVHSEGWISSAYYVEVPAETTDAVARSGWIQFGEPRFSVPGAAPEKFVQPEEGLLVLFPSYMWHGTTPIHGDTPRMTIAFDAVPWTSTGR